MHSNIKLKFLSNDAKLCLSIPGLLMLPLVYYRNCLTMAGAYQRLQQKALGYLCTGWGKKIRVHKDSPTCHPVFWH